MSGANFQGPWFTLHQPTPGGFNMNSTDNANDNSIPGFMVVTHYFKRMPHSVLVFQSDTNFK